MPSLSTPAIAGPAAAHPKRRLRIGIEAQRLFRPHKHGMDIVALELIRNLQQLDHDNEYFIFVKPDTDHSVLQETANFHLVEVAGGPYPFWEQVLLPRAARKARVDLLHCTSNTAPLRLPMPLVLTLHDIIYLEPLDLRRGSWYQRAGNLYRRWNVPRVVPCCERVLTVSAFEQARIEQRLPGPAGQVEVVYNSAGKQFRHITDPAALAAAKARYHLPDRFIFFLANTDPKKNLRGVLQALALLKKTGPLIREAGDARLPGGGAISVAARVGCLRPTGQHSALRLRAQPGAAPYLQPGRNLSLPFAARELRHSHPRSHGLWHAGYHQQHILDARSGWRRRIVDRPVPPRNHCRRHPATAGQPRRARAPCGAGT